MGRGPLSRGEGGTEWRRLEIRGRRPSLVKLVAEALTSKKKNNAQLPGGSEARHPLGLGKDFSCKKKTDHRLGTLQTTRKCQGVTERNRD